MCCCPLACPSPKGALRAWTGTGSHLPRVPEAGAAPSGAARFSRASQDTLDQQEQQQDRNSAVLVGTEAILTHAQGEKGDSVPTKLSCLVPVRLKARIPAWIRSWSLVLKCPYTSRIILSIDGGSRCGKQCPGAVTEPTSVFFWAYFTIKTNEFHSINFISNLAFLIRDTGLEGNCCNY